MEFFDRQMPLLVLLLERLALLPLLSHLIGFRLQVYFFNSLNGLIFPIFANTLASFFDRLFFWDSWLGHCCGQDV